MVTEEELDCDFRECGHYEIYRTQKAFDFGIGESNLVARFGYHPQVLGGDALREREACLGEDVVGGVLYPETATVNPYRFVMALAERAEKHGATLVSGAEVVEVEPTGKERCAVRTRQGEAMTPGRVIIATGAYSPSLLRRLGLSLPLQAAKGYHCDRSPEEGNTPALENAFLLGENSVFCTPMGDFVRFAGTLEFAGLNEDIRSSRLKQLTRAARRYFRGMGEGPSLSEWCGLRPCLADGLPVLGPVPGHPGIFIATGHAMQGLTLGPATGQLMAEHVLETELSVDVKPLGAERFPARSKRRA
jgi:D-amino-acid dehydrogenase